jgi:hypothetical protein
VQYVEKKIIKIDYNMLVQKKITLWGVGAMVKNLTPQCESEEFNSSHLQPRLILAT